MITYQTSMKRTLLAALVLTAAAHAHAPAPAGDGAAPKTIPPRPGVVEISKRDHGQTGVSFRTNEAGLQQLFDTAEAKETENIYEISPGIKVLVEGGGFAHVYLETQATRGSPCGARQPTGPSINHPERKVPAGANANLLVGQISGSDITLVNGVKVGQSDLVNHVNDVAVVIRTYALPAGLLKAGRNQIAIRVDFDRDGGLGMRDSDGSVHPPTWLNGTKIGHTGPDNFFASSSAWHTPRKYAIPPGLLKAADNEITLLDDDPVNDGGIGFGPVRLLFADPEKVERRQMLASNYLNLVAAGEDPYVGRHW